jgi:hypothetical protein
MEAEPQSFSRNICAIEMTYRCHQVFKTHFHGSFRKVELNLCSRTEADSLSVQERRDADSERIIGKCRILDYKVGGRSGLRSITAGEGRRPYRFDVPVFWWSGDRPGRPCGENAATLNDIAASRSIGLTSVGKDQVERIRAFLREHSFLEITQCDVANGS